MEADDAEAKPTERLCAQSRQLGYAAVLKRGELLWPILHVGGWAAFLGMLASTAGVQAFCALCRALAAGATAAEAAASPMPTFIVATVRTSIGSFFSFCALALPLERQYSRHAEGRCQPTKTRDLSKFCARSDVRLAVTNLTVAAAVSVAMGIHHAMRDAPERWTRVYLTTPATLGEWSYVFGSAVALFVWVDLWAYIAHRLLHLPLLYKTIHKVHHVYKQPTAFAALALHPLEFLLIFGGVYAAFFVTPLHISAIAANLIYVHAHNAIDHSGVYLESHLPWQPTSLYHDDHHKLFHVNYGQTFTLWDRLGGTFYSPKRSYGETSFSW